MYYSAFLVRGWKTIRRRPLRFIAVFLITIYAVCLLIVMISEKVSFSRATLFLLPSFFGELGDIKSTPKDIVSIVSLGIYVCFLGLIFGNISDTLMNLTMRGGILMKKVKYRGHIVICGWNYQGKMIIDDLLSDDNHRTGQIVILADLETIPYDSTRVDFIRGSPWKTEDLKCASMDTADTAIILTDIRTEKTDNPDAEALMVTLAIEHLHPEVHTCVQILNSENRIHLENAGADEIICLDQTGGKLAVASALHHGASKIIHELLTFDNGSEIYKIPIPDRYIGMSFTEAAKSFLDKKMILVAIETNMDDDALQTCKGDWIHASQGHRVIIINPQGNYNLTPKDFLFVISESEPENL